MRDDDEDEQDSLLSGNEDSGSRRNGNEDGNH
jgi:hypothetical protein